VASIARVNASIIASSHASRARRLTLSV